MPRPKKEGLDYFPLDIDIDQDDKIALVEAKHGAVGFALVVKLFMKIYKEGYFYKWGEKERLLFSGRVNVDINQVSEVVNDCIEWGLFNKELYEKEEILTSKGVQRRYIEAITRRKEVEFLEKYLLIEPIVYVGNSKIKIYVVDDDGNRVNVNINPNKSKHDDNNNPQSRVKESKVKESKEEKKEEAEKESGGLPHSRSCEFFVKNFSNHAPYIQDKIEDWEKKFPEEVVIASMKLALEKNSKRFSFCESILKEWFAEGLKTIDEVRSYENAKREQWKQSKGGQNNNPKEDELPKWARHPDQKSREKEMPDPEMEERQKRLQEQLGQM